jgi:uncharacterized protein GlcG (DUF336 family)
VKNVVCSCLLILSASLVLAAEPVVVFKTITQEAAEAVVAAAKAEAAKLESPIYKPAKTKMHVHVLGYEGTLMAATQAIGAWPGSDDIATRKARTSLLFKFPTRTIGELSRPELAAKGPLYAIELSNGGLISFPGGLPLVDANGKYCGAIGVSGDTVDMDEAVAKAGADALKNIPNSTVDLPGLAQTAAIELTIAAKAKAEQLDSGALKGQKCKMYIRVVGVEGTILGACGDEEAWRGSDDIALRKARCALLFKLPTRTIGELSRPELAAKGPLYGIEVSNDRLITFPGGLPLMDAAGNCVGAVGVSGDTVDNDEAVAKAAVERFQQLIKK